MSRVVRRGEGLVDEQSVGDDERMREVRFRDEEDDVGGAWWWWVLVAGGRWMVTGMKWPYALLFLAL